MRKNRPFLLIDAFSSGKQYVHLLEAMGYEIIHLISRADLLKQYGRPITPPETTYISKSYDDALNFIAQVDYEHILCCSEPGIDVFNHLNIVPSSTVYNIPSLAKARFDKFEMNNAIKLRGIEVIPHLMCDDVTQAIDFFKRQETKIVIKPCHSAGSDQVFFCDSEEQIIRAFNAIYGHKNALGKLNNRVYVQRFIDGQQYIVNGLCSNGDIAFTDIWKDVREVKDNKKMLDFEELLLPHTASSIRLQHFAQDILRAVGLVNGPFHMELIEQDDKLYHIEVGSRLMGSMSDRAYRSIFGFSPAEIHIEQLLAGFLPDLQHSQPEYTRCVTLRSFEDGILTLDLEEEFKHLPSYRGAYGTVKPGTAISHYQDLFDNLGTIYLSGTKAQVIKDYRAIRALEHQLTLPHQHLHKVAMR